MIPDQIHDAPGHNRNSYSGRMSANRNSGNLGAGGPQHSQSEQQFNRTMPYKMNPMSSILNP